MSDEYDFGLAYVGHAERWDKAQIDGRLEARDCSITYSRGGRKLAVAVIHRDLEGLRAEVGLERAIAARPRPALEACLWRALMAGAQRILRSAEPLCMAM